MAESRTILDVMTGPFARFFPMPTWRPWYLLATAAFGLTSGLSPEDEAFILRCLGRKELPREPATGLRLVIGRRGGKSRFASFLAVFLACFRDYSDVLSPGERGTVMIICPDRKQARTCLNYIGAFIAGVPALAALVQRRTKEAIHLRIGISIEVHTKSYRYVRGYTVIGYVLDEAPMLPTDDSAEPDTELIDALEPAMLTVPGAMGMLIGSPHARRGAFWRDYQLHFGVDGDPVLVWQADTKTMNPSASDAYIARKYADDEVVARAEYGAQFRSDLEAFVSREVLEAATASDRRELPPGGAHVAFVDPSGGAADSMTLAIAHQRAGKVVLDCVREVRAPFDPDEATRQFAYELRRYGIQEVRGDFYGGTWPASRFRAFGIRYEPSDRDKSEIYRCCIPLLMAGQVELLDLPVLRRQMLALERSVTKSGKERIDHPKGRRDDVANAVCGALLEASEIGAREAARQTVATILPNEFPPRPSDEWRRKYFEGRGARRRSALDTYGLVPAPVRSSPSLAMLAIREEHAREEARVAQWEREVATEIAEKHQRERQRAQHEQLKADVEEFGSSVVEALRRRTDPAFALPKELRGITIAKRTEEASS